MGNGTINEGYEIIYESTISDTLTVVLGRSVYTEMYVTWCYTKHGGYFWGHYFQNEEDALADLSTRIRKEKNHG